MKPESQTPEHLAELAAAITARRKERGMTLDEACAASGLSRTSWQGLEHGRRVNPRPSSLLAVDRALGWPGGYSRTIVRTGEPQALERSMRSRLDEMLDQLGDDALEQVAALAETLAPAPESDVMDRLEQLTQEIAALREQLAQRD